MRSRPETPEKYHRLEAELDSFDDGVRERALASLCDQVAADGAAWPEPGRFLNLHCHSFFSYNPDAYSPSKLAWLARWAGLEMSGLVDFDVLDGLNEFLAATERLALKACVSIESRVCVPEFSERVINSPGEPGIAYFLGAGFTTTALTGDTLAFLNGLRENAARRNRELVERVNAYTAPVTLDYEQDVAPLTPRGNATERHLCEAYARKAAAHFSTPDDLAAYWVEKLDAKAEDLDLPAGPKLQAAIRARTMKRGGVGYVQPDAGSFPLLGDMCRFVLDAGAIPTLAWLDGTSEGEQALEELFETCLKQGVSAVFLVPDRNFTPGVKDEKLKNLNAFIALAGQYHFPVIVGTEMNSPGQRFADNFDAEELKPLVPVFRKGAHILYAHAALQRKAGMGYLSEWSLRHFPERAERNDFFASLGRQLRPGLEPKLNKLDSEHGPDQVLGLIKGT